MTHQTMPERLLDLIQAEGIDTLFGIPDPSFFGMFIEAERRGMEIVSPHHEQAAALMADGYFRMTGKPVVLCMNKGPGVANVAAGANFLRKENVSAVCPSSKHLAQIWWRGNGERASSWVGF